MGSKKTPAADQSGLLFRSLAEQVKLPLITIAQAAELSLNSPTKDGLDQLLSTISLTSDATLQLIDGFILSVQLQSEAQLLLEPVSLSSVLYDTAHTLSEYAKAHDCELDLQLAGKFVPVMARREVVQAALLSLGYSFIESASTPGARATVTLAARRTAHGLNTGIFSSADSLSSSLFKQAKIMKGLVKQPLGDFSAGSGAGVFVADALFARLNSVMRVARFRSLQGLSATLTPSRQLSLV